MTHFKTITKAQKPAQAASLLQAQQIALILGSFATGIAALTGGLGNAFNLYTTAIERSVNIYQDKKTYANS